MQSILTYNLYSRLSGQPIFIYFAINQVNQYIHRILVEADSSAESGDDLWSAVREDLWSAVGEAGTNIYKRGDFKESQMADLDVYLLKKVKRWHLSL